MPKGQVWPAEWSTYADRATGFVVRQVTQRPPAQNTHFYFHDPAWTADARWFVFVSDRAGAPGRVVTGAASLFALDTTTGKLVQVTDRKVGHGMVSQRKPEVYYASGREMCATNLDTLEERTIGALPTAATGGRPALNADDSLLVFAGSWDGRPAILKMRASDGEVSPVCYVHGGHVHCSPTDPGLIMHCDDTVPDEKPKQRVWVLSTDGERHWHPYTQTPQEWLTHESWLGTTGKILACYWPTGLMELSLDGAANRLIARVNAWHAGASPDGSLCVVDTNWPDRGLHLIETATGRMCKLCETEANSAGLGAHPHPSFSLDGRYVVFGSERTGNPEVYMAEVAQAVARPDLWWTPTQAWHRF